MAALQGKTIRQYAVERLFPTDAEEDHAWKELKTRLRQRIADGLSGDVSPKSTDAIVNDELGEESRA